MKRIHLVSAMAAVATILGGCFDSQAPACSDPKVVKVVEETYRRELHEMLKTNPLAGVVVATLPSKMVSIESARPLKYDEKIKLRTCKGIARFDDNRTAEIEYTVQLDEKKNDKFYVELKLDFLDGLAKEGMMQIFFKKIEE